MNSPSDPGCPRCGATTCRVSPWRSEAEKREHRGEQPYRCLSCVHRFYRPARRSLLRDNPVIAAVGGGTLVLLLAVIALLWVWKSGDRPGGRSSVAPPQGSPGAVAPRPATPTAVPD